MRCFILLFLSLKCLGQDPRLIFPIGHGSFLTSAEFSPDGSLISTTSWDYTCRIWDTKTGKLLVVLEGHNASIEASKFLQDNKRIITFSSDNTAKLWNISTGKVVKEIKEAKGKFEILDFSQDKNLLLTSSNSKFLRIQNILYEKQNILLDYSESNIVSGVISPNGNTVAICFSNGMIKIIDTNTGIQKLIISGKKGIQTIKYSPDGLKIMALLNTNTENDIEAFFWDANSGHLLKTFKLIHHKLIISSVKFSHDSKRLLTGSWDKTAIVWNIETGDTVFILRGHNHEINDVAFTKDGKKLVTASSDNTANVWEYDSGDLLLTLRHEGKRGESAIRSARFSPDSKKVITASWDNSAKVWDAATGKLLADLNGHTKPLISASWSTNGENILLISEKSSARIFNKNFGKVTTIFNKTNGQLRSGDFSQNGNLVIGACWDKTAKIWDVNSGNIIMELKGHKSFVNSARFSTDGTMAITSSDDKTAIIWNANNGKIIKTLEGHRNYVFFSTFSPDDSKAITTSDDMTAKLWEVKTGKTKEIFKTGEYGVSVAAFFPYSPKLIIPTKNDNLVIWDITNKIILRTLYGHERDIQSIDISKKENRILTSSLDRTFKVWDALNGKILINNKAHNYYVRSAYFSPDGNRILTSSEDNTSKCWDAFSGKLLYTMFFPDSSDYLIFTPKKYYKSTTKAARLLHYVTKNLNIIPFDQLDIKYNRPDKVLEAIGSSDTALINSYRKAYYKRIKKLGVDTTSFKEGFTIPEADFKNREQVEYEQKNKLVKLEVSGKSTENLDRFNVWVNEVPVFGQKGINLRYRNKKIVDTTITITLSEGDNQVETSVTDVNGIESYRQPLFVKYIPQKPAVSKTYFIGIGINRFADSSHNLSWSVKDIRDLGKRFATKGAIIDTLFDENVTKSSVASLKKKLESTSEEDKVIIAYSGHGLLSKEYDYYLSTFNVDFNQPEKNGLPYDELEGLLDGIKARKKLMLIDACHSGEVDKEEMQHYKTVEDTLKNNNVKKGIILENKDQSKLGMKNSFELMQELFVNVGRSTGATIISAAAGTQFALERNDLKNGVFTYSLLELMNNNSTLKVSDLKKTVTEKVPQLTGGLQKPTFRNENQQFDWTLW